MEGGGIFVFASLLQRFEQNQLIEQLLVIPVANCKDVWVSDNLLRLGLNWHFGVDFHSQKLIPIQSRYHVDMER